MTPIIILTITVLFFSKTVPQLFDMYSVFSLQAYLADFLAASIRFAIVPGRPALFSLAGSAFPVLSVTADELHSSTSP